MTSRVLNVCLILLAGLAARESAAQSFGHYHQPSTLPQFCGLGYGAGHHAPMIRPGHCQPLRIERYVHIPGCGACGAMPMESFAGCNSPGCHAQLDQILRGANDGNSCLPTPNQLPGIEEDDSTTPTEVDALAPGRNWSLPAADPLPPSVAMMKLAAFVLALIVLLGIIGTWWQRRRRNLAQQLYQRAVEEFPRQTDLPEKFLAAANATGKPRGLRWIRCELQGEPIFATNQDSGEIYGLSGATIGFEAIPGGDMEDVEAVGDIRYVTAVFEYRDATWQTDGRAIFNLEPAQALERIGETLHRPD